jgi:hypothetical protein
MTVREVAYLRKRSGAMRPSSNKTRGPMRDPHIERLIYAVTAGPRVSYQKNPETMSFSNTISVVTVCVRNPDRSPVGINR